MACMDFLFPLHVRMEITCSFLRSRGAAHKSLNNAYCQGRKTFPIHLRSASSKAFEILIMLQYNEKYMMMGDDIRDRIKR